MNFIKYFLRSLIRAIFIVSLLIQYPSAIAQMNPVFQQYYNDYMFFIKTNCDDNQYRNSLILTITFGDLSKQGFIGETKSYDYEVIANKAILHYSDIVIDKKDWDRSSEDDRYAVIVHELTHAYFRYPDLHEEKYRKHFMFFSKENLKRHDVELQLLELLGILCHKQISLSGSTTK